MEPLENLLLRAKAGEFTQDKRPETTERKVLLTQIDQPTAKPTLTETTQEASKPVEEKALGQDDQPNLKVHYISNSSDAEATVKMLMASKGPIGFDIETAKLSIYKDRPLAGLDPHLSTIRLAQFANSFSEAYVFDIRAVGIDVIKPLFEKPLIAHNAVFEIKHLYHADIEPLEMHCSLLMYNALYGDRISLQKAVKRIFKEALPKKEQTSDWGADTLSQSQINYAAVDAIMALKLGGILSKRLNKKDLSKLYRVLWQAQYPVAKMEYYGCNFDMAGHLMLIKAWEAQLEVATEALKSMMGENVNIQSPKQISDWLKKNLSKNSFEKWPKTASGQLEISEKVLNNFSELDIVAPLLTFKKYSKLFSTYGNKFAGHINPATGRVHPSFSIAGANTGRFTCSKPNIQQMPRGKNFRMLFKAPPGRKMVVADYSQVELRVLAITTQDPSMLEAYEQGKDLHRLTASKISGVPFEQVTKEQRQGAKAVNFGLVFGMGARGLSAYAKTTYGVRITEKAAKKAIKAYFNTYPKISDWHKITYEESKKYRWAKTPLGRAVDLKAVPDKIYTKSKNIPIQGGAAEVMLAALIALDNKIASTGINAKMVNIVHDEIILEVAEEHAGAACSILEEAMIEGMLFVFPEAFTNGLVEAAIGDNWAETK